MTEYMKKKMINSSFYWVFQLWKSFISEKITLVINKLFRQEILLRRFARKSRMKVIQIEKIEKTFPLTYVCISLSQSNFSSDSPSNEESIQEDMPAYSHEARFSKALVDENLDKRTSNVWRIWEILSSTIPVRN